MERMRKIGLLVLISFLLALIICLPLFNKWLNVLLRVSETERKNNKGITFSIQHEDNPLNKELQDFAALYNALIENQKEGYKYYEIYSQYLENFSEQKGNFLYSFKRKKLELTLLNTFYAPSGL